LTRIWGTPLVWLPILLNQPLYVTFISFPLSEYQLQERLDLNPFNFKSQHPFEKLPAPQLPSTCPANSKIRTFITAFATPVMCLCPRLDESDSNLRRFFFSPYDLTLRRLMSYIYGAPILDVSRSHTTTQHSQ
jgi:hypothetical protein